MSKVEKFISDCTRNCSNELIAVESRAGKEVISYHEWLTPDQARSAVEIAREEVIEWIDKHWREYIDVDADGFLCFGHWKNDLRKAIQDKTLKTKERKQQ